MQVGSPVFEGRSSGWDGAIVYALRKAGAAVVGKTVTTEFAFATPRSHAQPLGPRPHARRLVQRQRRGGGRADDPGCHRLSGARVHSQTRRLLRRLHAESLVRRDQFARRISVGAQPGPCRLHCGNAGRHVDRLALRLAHRRRRSRPSEPRRTGHAAQAGQAGAPDPAGDRRLGRHPGERQGRVRGLSRYAGGRRNRDHRPRRRPGDRGLRAGPGGAPRRHRVDPDLRGTLAAGDVRRPLSGAPGSARAGTRGGRPGADAGGLCGGLGMVRRLSGAA